jgi:hypothetical protein
MAKSSRMPRQCRTTSTLHARCCSGEPMWGLSWAETTDGIIASENATSLRHLTVFWNTASFSAAGPEIAGVCSPTSQALVVAVCTASRPPARPFIVAPKPMTSPLQPLRPRLGDRHDVRKPILRFEEGARPMEPRHIVVD